MLGSFAPFQLIFGVEFLLFILFFFVVAVVLFILIGIWLYRDANSRAMDGTLWFVILLLASIFGGFIGGIIVLVIYLVLRESHPVGGPRYPYGYSPYPPPATAPYQGYPPQAYAPPPAAPAAPSAAAARCPRCGTPTAPGARFCASCGSPL